MEESELTTHFRAHHASGGTKFDDLHNEQHQSIEEKLSTSKGGGLSKQVARNIAEEATQLKITANLLNSDGNQHQDQILSELNQNLPESDKFVLSNGKTSLE